MCKGKTDLSLSLGDTPVSPRAFEFVAWRHPLSVHSLYKEIAGRRCDLEGS